MKPIHIHPLDRKYVHQTMKLCFAGILTFVTGVVYLWMTFADRPHNQQWLEQRSVVATFYAAGAGFSTYYWVSRKRTKRKIEQLG